MWRINGSKLTLQEVLSWPYMILPIKNATDTEGRHHTWLPKGSVRRNPYGAQKMLGWFGGYGFTGRPVGRRYPRQLGST